MRQQMIPVALIAMLMASTAAAAQNYVAANRYNNPDVVVNFDILGGGMTAPMPHFPPPVMRPPMPAPQPVQLTPPAPRLMPAPVPMAQPMQVPQAMPAPRPPMDMTNVHLAPPRVPMMDAPPAAPAEPARMVPPMPVLDQPLADAPPAPRPEKSSASRQLLAQARAEAAESEPVAASAKKSAARSPVLFDDVMPPPPQDELAPAPKAVGSQKASSVLPMQLGLPQEEPLPPVAAVAPQPPVKKETAPVDNFEAYRLFFADKASSLSPEEDKVLRGLITKLKRDEKIRVQILAFAASTPDTASAARRLSLTRALAVRSAMVSDGINAERMEVRAMGGGDKTQPPDRVDLVFQR